MALLYDLDDRAKREIIEKLTQLLGYVDGLVDIAREDDPLEAINLQARMFRVYGDISWVIGYIGGSTDAKEVADAVAARFKPQGGQPQHSGDDELGQAPEAGGSSRAP